MNSKFPKKVYETHISSRAFELLSYPLKYLPYSSFLNSISFTITPSSAIASFLKGVKKFLTDPYLTCSKEKLSSKYSNHCYTVSEYPGIVVGNKFKGFLPDL